MISLFDGTAISSLCAARIRYRAASMSSMSLLSSLLKSQGRFIAKARGQGVKGVKVGVKGVRVDLLIYCV
jgi:hypothetical protein